METNNNKMILYYFPNFRSNRCIWLVHELGVTNDVQFELFNTRDMDKSKVDHYRRTVHPLGTVPALVTTGKEPMIESGAICMYLAELYQKLLPEYSRKMDYLKELEIKDTNESSVSVSYLHILLNIDINGKLTTQLYDKRDDFSFSIVNFPYLCSNIPSSSSVEENTVDMTSVIFYCCGTIDEILEHLFVQWMFTEPEKRDNALIQNMMIKFDAAASHLEKLLHNRKFICGDEFTAADCVFGYNIWWASVMQGGKLLNNHPELLSYYDRLKRRDSFKLTFS